MSNRTLARQPFRTQDAGERILRRIRIEGDCWIWQRAVREDGYGVFGMNGLVFRAHRASYEAFVGPIPADLQLDHKCHNRDVSCAGGSTCRHRRCVNPDHLEPVTSGENSLRSNNMSRGRKSHCVNGHAYTEVNTYWHPDGNGKRACRVCRLISSRRRGLPISEADAVFLADRLAGVSGGL